MLEKPELQEEKLIACLQDAYGLPDVRIAFLPLGADPNTAVYRAITANNAAYFVKLRRGVLDETSVTLPRFFHDLGIAQIIPPLTARTGKLWARLDAFTVILYPFIAGRDGYAVTFSERQWREVGAALKRIHTANVPAAITALLRRETYAAQWRESVQAFLSSLDDVVDDPVAHKTAAFLKRKREAILALVERTDRLALMLQARHVETIVCHSDLHAGNLLIDDHDAFFIVDWDSPILG